jgi:hypothetical protein
MSTASASGHPRRLGPSGSTFGEIGSADAGTETMVPAERGENGATATVRTSAERKTRARGGASAPTAANAEREATPAEQQADVLVIYAPGSWGPDAASRLVEHLGGWHDPWLPV